MKACLFAVAIAAALLTSCGIRANPPAIVNVPPAVNVPPVISELHATSSSAIEATYIGELGDNFNGLDVNIQKIQVFSKQIILTIAIKNTVQEPLTWYPILSSIVIGDRQLSTSSLLTTGDLDGDIQPGVTKTGTVAYDMPEGQLLDVNKVGIIKIVMGSVRNAKSFDSTEPELQANLQEATQAQQLTPSTGSAEAVQSAQQPTSATARPIAGQVGTLIASDPKARINLRDEPSANTPTKRYGLVGDRVLIQDSISGSDGYTWYKVRFQQSGAIGWIRADFVSF